MVAGARDQVESLGYSLEWPVAPSCHAPMLARQHQGSLDFRKALVRKTTKIYREVIHSGTGPRTCVFSLDI